MLLTLIDAITIIVFLVITVAAGLFYKNKDDKNEKLIKDLDDETQVEEYILGNNKIGFVATGFSLSASFLSAFGMIGLPTQAMISGTVIFFSQVCVSCIVVGLIHFYILPLLKKHKLPSVFAIIKYKYRKDKKIKQGTIVFISLEC